jgi:hypothetical protein
MESEIGQITFHPNPNYRDALLRILVLAQIGGNTKKIERIAYEALYGE